MPLFYIIDGINSNIKVSCEAEDLYPEQQIGGEKLVDFLMYFINIVPAAGSPCKVFCPELTGILQCLSNVGILAYIKIFNLTERDTAIQLTDVPLQPCLHHFEA